jgi:hypothetical protein
MKKLIFAAVLTALTGLAVFAQSSSDYKKGEFYVGYSNGQVDTGVDTGNSVNSFFNDRLNFNGVEVAGVYNMSRYFGVKGDFSATYNNKDFAFTTTNGNVAFDTKSSLYNVLGGVQIKDNSKDTRFKPFAHALAGIGHGRTKVSNVSCSGTVDCTGFAGTDSDTGFAAVLGGGIDIKLSNKIDLRAIQVDYNPIRFNGSVQNNLRLGVGLVF